MQFKNRVTNFEKHQIPWRLSAPKSLSKLARNLRRISTLLERAALRGDDMPYTREGLVFSVRARIIENKSRGRLSDERQRQSAYCATRRWLGRRRQHPLSVRRMVEVCHRLTAGSNSNQTQIRKSDAFLDDTNGCRLWTFPPADALSNLIGDLERWQFECAPKTDPVLSAIQTHGLISNIHVFRDGNGRTARAYEFSTLLSAGIVLHHFWEPELIAHLDFGGYDRAFARSRQVGTLDPFVEFMLETYLGAGEFYLRGQS